MQISDDNPTGKAETHFRNVKTTNWSDNSKAKALANLGGGPRPQPKTEKGVPIYFHGYFPDGKTALVVSSRSPEFKADPEKFRTEPPLTGNESRVAEVKDVAFPSVRNRSRLPTTVITRDSQGWAHRARFLRHNGLVASDRKRQGRETIAPNFAEWERLRCHELSACRGRGRKR